LGQVEPPAASDVPKARSPNGEHSIPQSLLSKWLLDGEAYAPTRSTPSPTANTYNARNRPGTCAALDACALEATHLQARAALPVTRARRDSEARDDISFPCDAESEISIRVISCRGLPFAVRCSSVVPQNSTQTEEPIFGGALPSLLGKLHGTHGMAQFLIAVPNTSETWTWIRPICIGSMLFVTTPDTC
jgi:hypothetical protein